MSQEQLRRMLADSAEGIEVGPAPARRPVGRHGRVRVLAAGAALVAAAVVVTAVVVTRTGDEPGVAVDRPRSERLPLLTGPPPGDGPVMAALAQGRVVADGRGCAVLTSGGSPQALVWPHGWTSYAVDGALLLRDASGQAVVHEGDWITAGGGLSGLSTRDGGDDGSGCAPLDGRDPFLVQSEPEVVAPTPLPLFSSGARPGTGPSRDLGGVLRVEEGCLLLREDDGTERLTVWPEEWTAGTDPDGVTSVRDGDGRLRATTGEPVRVTGTRRGAVAYGGSYEPVEPGAGTGCGQGAVFVRDVAPGG